MASSTRIWDLRLDFDILVKYPVEGQVSNVSMKNVMSWNNSNLST